MSAEQRLRAQLRARTTLQPASSPDDVICCGHDLDAHDDDGCTVGWHAADERQRALVPRSDGCPCRCRGWAR